MAITDEAKRLYDKGIDDYRVGEYEEAQEALIRARELYAEAGDRKGEAEALNDLGVVCIQLEEWEKAEQSLDEALTIRMAMQDRSGQGITLGNMGMLYDHRGDDDRAIETYRQALAIFQELGEKGNEKAVARQLKKMTATSFLDMLGGMFGRRSEPDEEDKENIIDVTPEPVDEE